MANPLDELNAPYNPDGLEARVIHKQLPVQIGIESVIFEIAIWASGFVIAAIITFAVKPQWENWGMLLLWLAAFLPGVIYAIMKINAKNYFMSLLQRIQSSASTIGNYQEQRFEILKNVVGLVQKAVNLDSDVMKAVAAYRGGVAPDASLGERDEAITRGFAALMPHVENYPELQAHASIADAMRQNNYLQREITAARDLYNQQVLIWNTEVFSWPVKQIVAARMHLTTRVPFTVSKETLEGSKSVFF